MEREILLLGLAHSLLHAAHAHRPHIVCRIAWAPPFRVAALVGLEPIEARPRIVALPVVVLSPKHSAELAAAVLVHLLQRCQGLLCGPELPDHVLVALTDGMRPLWASRRRDG
eukprot:scaffold6844_cov357-Prasinococcus_capsulatus_cf.AAC.2